MKQTKNILPNPSDLPSFSLDSFELGNLELDEPEDDLEAGELVEGLTEEIKSVRDKNETFKQEINCENYLILVFSTKEDKEEFSKNVSITDHTVVDGYSFAKTLNVEPQKPKFKMRGPMKKGDRKM